MHLEILNFRIPEIFFSCFAAILKGIQKKLDLSCYDISWQLNPLVTQVTF